MNGRPKSAAPIQGTSAFSFDAFFNTPEAGLDSIAYDERATEAKSPSVKKARAIMTQLQQMEKKDPQVFKNKVTCHSYMGDNPVLSLPTDSPELSAGGDKLDNSTVEILNKDCITAVVELHNIHPGHQIAMLNMANLHAVGGGFFIGAIAQEERIFQVTTLAAQLLYYAKQNGGFQRRYTVDVRPTYGMTSPQRYSFAQTDILYSSGMIVRSPIDARQPEEELKETEYVPINFITSAAMVCLPIKYENYEYNDENGKSHQKKEQDAPAIYKKIIRNQLRVAISQGNTIYVAGPMGCGAFHNSPILISECFRSVFEEPEFFGKIKIYFAIYDGPATQLTPANQNLLTFQKKFQNPLQMSTPASTSAVPETAPSPPPSQEEKKETNSSNYYPYLGSVFIGGASSSFAYFFAGVSATVALGIFCLSAIAACILLLTCANCYSRLRFFTSAPTEGLAGDKKLEKNRAPTHT